VLHIILEIRVDHDWEVDLANVYVVEKVLEYYESEK